MEEIKLPGATAPSQPKQSSPTTAARLLKAIPQKHVSKIVPAVIIILVVAAGIFSGLIFSSRNKAKEVSAKSVKEEELTGETKQSFNQTFRDEAEGTIEKND